MTTRAWQQSALTLELSVQLLVTPALKSDMGVWPSTQRAGSTRSAGRPQPFQQPLLAFTALHAVCNSAEATHLLLRDSPRQLPEARSG